MKILFMKTGLYWDKEIVKPHWDFTLLFGFLNEAKVINMKFFQKIFSVLSMIFFLIAISTSSTFAATYYIDSKIGNDIYTGTSPVTAPTSVGPWRTLEKANKTNFVPGDIIRLACGSVWNETLKINSSGTLTQPITINANPLGCANPPLIDGSFIISPTSWVKYSGNIYRTTVSAGEPQQLTASSGPLSVAHFPNKGYDIAQPDSVYLHAAADSDVTPVAGRNVSTSIVTGPDFKLPAGATINAETRLRIRLYSWIMDEMMVSGFSGSRLFLAAPTTYPLKAGWGYYLFGQLWMLDSPGEWAYDKASQIVYVWMPDSKAPSVPVSAAYLPVGINIESKSYVHIDGVSIKFTGLGINMRKTTGIVIRNSIINDVYNLGIAASGSQSGILESNFIARVGMDAINAAESGLNAAVGLQAIHNQIRDSGVILNGETILSLPRPSHAAIMSGYNSTVVGNTIENTGNIGIMPLRDSLVDDNYIFGVCTVLDDCGAVYTGTIANNSLVTNNLIIKSRGALPGKPPGEYYTQAQGIYLDEAALNVTVKGNTIIDADNGLHNHRSARSVVENNKFYGNRKSQIWLQETSNKVRPTGDIYENVVRRNEIVPTIPGSLGFLHTTSISSAELFGQYDENHYFDAIFPRIGVEQTPTQRMEYNLSQWKAATNSAGAPRNMDKNGRGTLLKGYALYSVSGSNLVPNGKFLMNSSGWGSWNQNSPYGSLVREACSLGFCLRYNAGASSGLVNSPYFAVIKDQWYRLSFDLMTGEDNQSVNVIVRRGAGGKNGYESLSNIPMMAKGTKTFKRYSFVFKAIMTINVKDPLTLDNGARLDFSDILPGQSMSFGNVEIVPVTPVDNAFRTDILVNPTGGVLTVECPLKETFPTACASYARFSDDALVTWPYSLLARRSEIVYTHNKTLVDTDNDGIADAQDLCPGTPAGSAVNAAGCGFGVGVMNPLNGKCGTSHGQSFSVVPTTGFCAAGNATPVTGSGPWSWTCTGSSGGTTALCSAVKTATTPTATISVSPASIAYNEKTNISWSSTGATSCSASWSPLSIATWGTISIGPLTSSVTVWVNCTNGSLESGKKSATITVAPQVLPTPMTSAFVQFNLNDNAANTFVSDESTAKNNGAANVNTSALSVPGKINSALSFNGINQYVNITSLFDSIRKDKVGAFSFWVKPVNGEPIVSFATANGHFLLAWSKGLQAMAVAISGAGTMYGATTPSGTVPINTYTHVVVTQDGSKLKFYINGVEQVANVWSNQNPGAWLNTIVPTVGYGRLGAFTTGGSSDFFAGSIDDVRYYQKSLDFSEVQALFNNGAGTELLNPLSYGTSILDTKPNPSKAKVFAQFKFNDSATTSTVLDEFGKNGMANVSTSAISTPGKINKALTFNGANQYVDISNLFSTIRDDKAGSFSLWVKPVNGEPILSFATSNGYFEMAWSKSLQSLAVGISGAGTMYGATTPLRTVPVNTYSHIVVTQDANKLKLYVNGVEQNQNVWSNKNPGGWLNTIVPARAYARVGAFTTGTATDFFNGSVDDLRYYKTALTSDEVLAIYNDGQGTEEASPAFISLRPSGNAYQAVFSGKGYYVDAALGSDSNPGTIDKPWKTLAKASSAVLSNGDALLLNCSSTWREKPILGTTFVPQGGGLLAGYGICDELHYPTIKGSDVITSGWSKDPTSPNPVYVTSQTLPPTQIFVNGQRLIKARYPNFGGINHEYHILKQAVSNSNLTFSDADRDFLADKDITGADLYVRIEPWYIDHMTINRYNSAIASVFLNRDTRFPAEAGDGYVLEGKKWMLDSAGEWYYDTAASQLYVWLPDNSHPASSLVEASVRNEVAVLRNSPGLRVEHIKFEQGADRGLDVQSGQNIFITDIVGENDKNYNLVVLNAKNTTVTHSAFSGALAKGVVISGGNNNALKNSEISSIGLSGAPDIALAGVDFASENGLVQDNLIENMGYIGIRFANKEGTRIIQNTIKNVCVRLSDCAGIYTWNGTLADNPLVGSLVEKNTIIGAASNREGTTPSHGGGIFLDNSTVHVRVLNNMISDVSIGLVLNEPSDTIFSNNKIWKASTAALSAGGRAGYLLRNTVSNNVFFSDQYSTIDPQTGAPKKIVDYAQAWWPAVSADRVFKGPEANIVSGNKLLTFSGQGGNTVSFKGQNYSQKEWNAFGPTDVQFSPVQTKHLAVTTVGNSLISNGQFNSSGSSWTTYFSVPGTGRVDYGIYPQCGGSCAHFVAGNPGDLLISPKFNLDKTPGKNIYVLSYTAIGGVLGGGASATVRRTVSPWDNFGYQSGTATLAPGQTRKVMDLFYASNNADARMDLYGQPGKDVYFDDVALYKVSSYKFFDPYEYSRHLINNTSIEKIFSCADAKLPACDAVDENGKAVQWPVTLPPFSSVIIMAKDPAWVETPGVASVN